MSSIREYFIDFNNLSYDLLCLYHRTLHIALFDIVLSMNSIR